MATEKRLIDANDVVKKLECEIETQCQPVPDSGKGLEAFIGMVLPMLLRDVINYINKQPTVDAVEVVHGRWLQHGEFAMCSECTELFKEREVTVFRYCPECGAKMDGDGNG